MLVLVSLCAKKCEKILTASGCYASIIIFSKSIVPKIVSKTLCYGRVLSQNIVPTI